MGTPTAGADDHDRDDHPFLASRGPVLDRLSTIAAVTGYLLLATNDAPPLSAFGFLEVVVGCLAVGTLVGLVLYRLLGPGVRGPLWLGVITAVALSIPLLLVLLLTGNYTSQLGWVLSLGAATFGLGATARAVRARRVDARSER
ncbi:hypothetical protein [Halopiger goleimassiliensis]|uniref:hypothetical protein n=1 Tax=Halopiger goleimassiliensis TaxID=1293048 RepID=UPI000677D035|nr:hypothetical protein [Halopiger goleimassiliensis]